MTKAEYDRLKELAGHFEHMSYMGTDTGLPESAEANEASREAFQVCAENLRGWLNGFTVDDQPPLPAVLNGMSTVRENQLVEALKWMSKGLIFQPGGKCRESWERIVAPLLEVPVGISAVPTYAEITSPGAGTLERILRLLIDHAARDGYFASLTREEVYICILRHAADEITKEATAAAMKVVDSDAAAKKTGTFSDALLAGYGGVLPSGELVDRRQHPAAVPIPANTMLGVPDPKPTEADQPISLSTKLDSSTLKVTGGLYLYDEETQTIGEKIGDVTATIGNPDRMADVSTESDELKIERIAPSPYFDEMGEFTSEAAKHLLERKPRSSTGPTGEPGKLI